MAKASLSDHDFITAFEEHGPARVAAQLKLSIRAVFARRRDIELRTGQTIKAPTPDTRAGQRGVNQSAVYQNTIFPERQHIEIEDGIILVGSDCHYWPGTATTAHLAFLKFCKMFRNDLVAVVLNGDVLDGAGISRHAPIGWEKRPTLIQELEAVQERLGEIEKATGDVPKIWTLGNHDARFETRLAMVAPEYAKINGVHLKDHFGRWLTAWRVDINDDCVIKHRFKSGIHAPWNNTMWAGKSIITGHLHSQKVYPFTDYRATRWGCDTGCMADPEGRQFVDYLEAGPTNWRSGFGVITYYKGQMLQPELVRVMGNGLVDFRGKVWEF
jgi:hypothetical protein